MSVYRDKRNGRWRFSFMYAGKRYSGSCPPRANNQRNAERLERLRQEEIVAGRKRKADTIEVLAEKFLAHQAKRVAPLTLETVRNHIESHIVPAIGRRRADEIDKAALDALATTWLEKAMPSTVNVRMGTLIAMLARAQEWDMIASVPKYEAIKVPKETPRFLTEDEATRLLDAARKTPWYSMILIGLRTGLRIGELRGLQWGDITLATRTIQVRRTDPGRPDLGSNAPKGKRERTIPLSNDAYACLAELRPADAKPRDWVWPALLYKGKRPERDRCRSESGCQHGIRAAVIAAGLIETADERIGFHTLRHTFASWLVLRGVSLRVIQDLLGHASISQTEAYAHLVPNAVHHAEVARLDFALVGGETKQLTEGE